MTRDDGLDNPRRQERRPSQAPEVVWEHSFTPAERGNRFHLTATQIVRPLASPRDRFDEREIGRWSWRATALEKQAHFEPAPPDLHRKDARDRQRSGVRTVLLFRDGVWELDGHANAGIDEVDAIDQCIQGGTDFNLRLQALHPCRRE